MCAGSNCVVELICGWVRGNGSTSPTATRHQQYTGEERFFLRAGHFDEDGLQFLRRRCRRLSFLLRPCALCSQCRGSGILDLRPVQWDGGGAQVEVRFTRILPCSSRWLFQVRVLIVLRWRFVPRRDARPLRSGAVRSAWGRLRWIIFRSASLQN